MPNVPTQSYDEIRTRGFKNKFEGITMSNVVQAFVFAMALSVRDLLEAIVKSIIPMKNQNRSQIAFYAIVFVLMLAVLGLIIVIMSYMTPVDFTG